MTQVIKTTQAIKTKGIVGSALNLLLAFIVLIVGLFSIELSRYMLARDQLKCDLEAAVLCSQTTLASTGTPTNSRSQTTAINTGLSLFQQNAILGQPLSNASLVRLTTGQTKPQFDVQPGETQICFQFLDPITLLPINSSSSGQNTNSLTPAQNGTVLQATGAYCYSPLCGKFIGLGSAQFTVQLAVNSGLPQLDVVFVYDVSGAENRQTPVTYAQRYWDTPNGIDYLLPSPIGDPPTQTITGGPLAPFCITNALPQGPNPTTPQNLDNSQKCPSRQINYAEQSGSGTQYLTGKQGYAAPPGNYPYNGHLNTMAMFASNSNYSGLIYVPCQNFIPPISSSFVISLSDFIAVPTSRVSPGTITVPVPYDNVSTPAPIVYIPKAAFAHLPASISSTYQTPYILSNSGTNHSAEPTVTLGGGSAFQTQGPYPVPTGPILPVGTVDVNGNVIVASASVLAGNTYDNYGHSFTDGVVNIDGNATFQSTSVTYNGNSFSFPNLGVVIEAARGNLENPGNSQAAGLNLQALGLTQANLQSGYYAAYVQAALKSIQPMNTVANATTAFMNQLATVSDAHFGCLTFNDYVGSNASSTAPPSGTTAPDNIATDYPYSTMNSNPDGSVGHSITNTYLLPDILLDPSGNTTQSTIANVLPTIHTWGNCGVAGALKAAISELTPLTNVARPSANKAIILVTTQAPNVGLNGDTGPLATSDAISMASLAHKAGIPIYCVAIAQSGTDDQNEDAAYNDNKGGIAATAGYGSKYYRIDWSNATTTQASLTSAFANIARRLTCLVH